MTQEKRGTSHQSDDQILGKNPWRGQSSAAHPIANPSALPYSSQATTAPRTGKTGIATEAIRRGGGKETNLVDVKTNRANPPGHDANSGDFVRPASAGE
ncbi:hypothetical protein N7462_006556 [Penicillium macrosclerotiorum]|uniref:uncharacterized protein n=1 Tax=Penicillium macrosclerotiorum TaxID=303699 RepID=UPI0025476FE5|nr:uncharacterized protein N7462_006556 [Penicillium macrosclerotiorum]KAJ5683391.1 hypothetical protein N7462_006556 [Penicillium macrosclerotiorum]